MYKFVSICNGTRGDSCAYTRWKMDDAPRILFVPPVTIIREWQAERGNPSIPVKSASKPALFLETRPSRCEQPPSLNSIKRFHLHFASRTVFRTVANGSKKKIEPRPREKVSFFFEEEPSVVRLIIFVQQRLRCISYLCCNDDARERKKNL